MFQKHDKVVLAVPGQRYLGVVERPAPAVIGVRLLPANVFLNVTAGELEKPQTEDLQRWAEQRVA